MEDLNKYYSGDYCHAFNTMNANPKLKGEIIKYLRNKFEEKYPPERKMIMINDDGEEVPGVGDYNSNNELIWSCKNRLNTNYGGLTYVKDVLVELSGEEINFEAVLTNTYSAYGVLKKFFRLFDEHFDTIMDENGKYYKNLSEILITIWKKGQKYTKQFNNTDWKIFFPTAVGVESEDDEEGGVNDMLYGIDSYVIFDIKGEKIKKAIQVRGATCYHIDSRYIVYTSMVLSKYKNVWAFAFYDKAHQQAYLFKNHMDKIEQIINNKKPALSIPEELLHKKIDYVDK